MPREPTDMHLVDDGSLEWSAWVRVTLPIIEAKVDHDTLECDGGVVSGLAGRLPAILIGSCDAFSIGIEQNLSGIEAEAVGWVVRTMHAERIKLTVRRARYKRMPVVIGAMDAWIERNHTRGPRVIHVVEQAQFDTFTVLSEYAEIGAPVAKRGPQWETAALRDGFVHLCPPPR